MFINVEINLENYYLQKDEKELKELFKYLGIGDLQINLENKEVINEVTINNVPNEWICINGTFITDFIRGFLEKSLELIFKRRYKIYDAKCSGISDKKTIHFKISNEN